MAGGTAIDFFKELYLFFADEPLSYVDVGANRGHVFRDLMASGLNVDRALLFEPNPKAFTSLTKLVNSLGAAGRTSCYNIALSDRSGMVHMSDMDDMSKILSSDDLGLTKSKVTFVAKVEPLRSFIGDAPYERISILKIDVEGHELEVLKGCDDGLSAQFADLIYVEAGFNVDNKQQTYYRILEDFLLARGYRLFRIYEQTHEWVKDSPYLRRANLAFMSGDFALRHPMSSVHVASPRRGVGSPPGGFDNSGAAAAEHSVSQNAEMSAVKRERDRLKAELSESLLEIAERAAALAKKDAEIARLTCELKSISAAGSEH